MVEPTSAITRRRAMAAIALGCSVVWAMPARAGQGEREASAAVGADLGLGRLSLELGGAYWWRDLLALDAALDLGLGLRARPLDAAHVGARVGVRAALDALTFCPWLGASAGAAWTAPGVGLLARAEAGVAYRPARAWALHLRLAYRYLQGGAAVDQRVLLLVGASRWAGGAAGLDF